MVFKKFLKFHQQSHHTEDPEVATDSSHPFRASVPDNRCWDSYGDEEYVNEHARET